MVKAELEELLVPDAAAWRAWLLEHHAETPGVWLVLRKFGGTFIRMTPRGPRSNWSVSNVERVERLDAEGRMHPAGWAAVDVAKANGRWDAVK